MKIYINRLYSDESRLRLAWDFAYPKSVCFHLIWFRISFWWGGA